MNAVGTKVQVAFTVPVSGLIPDLNRSDGSSPQASCDLSLVSPVNRQLKRRVPLNVQIVRGVGEGMIFFMLSFKKV